MRLDSYTPIHSYAFYYKQNDTVLPPQSFWIVENLHKYKYMKKFSYIREYALTSLAYMMHICTHCTHNVCVSQSYFL